MNQFKILPVDSNNPDFESVSDMLKDLFAYLSTSELLIPLAEKGESTWSKSIEKVIDGKFGILFIAYDNSQPIGFVHAMIRFTPPYLGNLKVGYISQLYVKQAYRNNSIGTLLMKAAEDWFDSKCVHSYELSVHSFNKQSIEYYHHLGYQDELIQMRKFTPKKEGNL